jgi:hypothetical protein
MTDAADSQGFHAGLRGFGPLGLLAVLLIVAAALVIIPAAAVLILLWVWLSKTPWRDIGYVRPSSWIGGLVVGILFGVALKVLMKAVVMPLLGAPPVNPVYHYLAGDAQAVGRFAVYAVLGAGFGEETVFRGYLFERFGKLFGQSAGAKLVIVLLTTALFAVAHWQQGLPGIEQAAVVGFTVAAIFAVTGRIWMLMVAHAAFDLTAAAMIYFDIEAKVAHLIFK